MLRRIGIVVLCLMPFGAAANDGADALRSQVVKSARDFLGGTYACEAAFGEVFVPNFRNALAFVELELISLGMPRDEAIVAMSKWEKKIRETVNPVEKSEEHEEACRQILEEEYQKMRTAAAGVRLSRRHQTSK